MDDTLRNAIDRRDAALREVEAWNAFIAAYTAQLDAQKVEAQIKATQADLFARQPTSRARRKATTQAMMDEAERMILEAGRPLTRFQLLTQLEDRGFTVEGGDKSKVLGTNLWRSKRFHNIEKAGYWPKSQPIPAPYDTLPQRSSMLS